MTHLRPHIGRDGESYSQPFCAHLAECDPYTICSSPQWKYTVSLKSYESLSGDINNPCTKLSLLHLIPGSKITTGLKPPIIIVLLNIRLWRNTLINVFASAIVKSEIRILSNLIQCFEVYGQTSSLLIWTKRG